MKKWSQVPLGECCEIISGSTPRTGVKEYWDGDVCWATPKDLSELRSAYIETTERRITKEGLNSCSATVLPTGSVLFSSRAPIGLTAINTTPMCTNQGFKSLVPDASRVHNKYLYHWLKTNRKRLEDLGNGATFKEVSKSVVSRVEIPLPPIPEQRRIAAILDKADSLREKRRQAIAKLDELLKSVFIEMFGDPVTNPKGWPIVDFDEVCKTRLGKMLDEKKQTGLHRRPYLRNANVQWDYLDLSSVFEMDFDEKEREIFRLRTGDLLICEGGEVGRTAVWRNELPECYFQKALHRGRPNLDKTTPEYLLYLMWFYAKWGGLKDHVTSVTIAHLTGEKLKLVKIPLPPISLQRNFTEITNKVRALKEKLENASESVSAFFNSLQQRAFSGELFTEKTVSAPLLTEVAQHV